MAKREHTNEEIVTDLRQVGVAISNGKTTPSAFRTPPSPDRQSRWPIFRPKGGELAT